MTTAQFTTLLPDETGDGAMAPLTIVSLSPAVSDANRRNCSPAHSTKFGFSTRSRGG